MKGPKSNTKFVVIHEHLFNYLLSCASQYGISVNEIVQKAFEREDDGGIHIPPFVLPAGYLTGCGKSVRVTKDQFKVMQQFQLKAKALGVAVDLTSILQAVIIYNGIGDILRNPRLLVNKHGGGYLPYKLICFNWDKQVFTVYTNAADHWEVERD